MKKFLLSLAAMAAFAPAFAGTGTQADPYTVADLLGMSAEKVDNVAVTNIESAYVKGYIVGACKSGSGKIENLATFSDFTGIYSNVILADAQNCTDGTKCIAVQLPSKTDIRTNVNLGDHPDNLGKQLLVAGNVTPYFDKVGVRTPTSYELTGEGTGTVNPPVSDERVNVATIAEFLAQPAKTKVTFTGSVNTVYQNGTNLYVQDATGGMFIYGTTNQTYSKGDVIPGGFEGQYTDYNGCIEFEIAKGSDAKFAASTGTATVEPAEWTLEDISTDIQNHYVVVKGVNITEGADAKNFNLEQDGTTLPLYDKFAINVAVGENLNVIGVVSVFNNKLQVYPIEITNASGEVIEAVAAPKFSVAAGTVEAGTSVEITCATEGASIYYTLDGTEPTAASTLYAAPIVVNEAVTIKAIAVKEGLNDSPVATAAYTIKGNEPVGDGIVFNFADPTTLTPSYDPTKGEADGTTGNLAYNVSDVAFTNGTVSVTTTKGSSTDARIYYQPSKSASQYRIYKGSTLTVATTGDAAIANIIFTLNNTKVGVKPEWTKTDDGKVFTYAPNAKSASFAISENMQINKIEVILEGGAGVEAVVADDAEAPVEYYNLQGVRVAEPESGLYIRRQGNKVEKVVIR